MILQVFFNQNVSVISVILCFVHRVHIICVFKCQLCKSGGERIHVVLLCCKFCSFFSGPATIIPVHIQWQKSHSLRMVRISSSPLSLRRLARKKPYWTSISLTKSLQKKYSLTMKYNFRAIPFPYHHLDSRDRLAVTAID